MAANILNNIKPYAVPYLYVGCSKELGANRVIFGEAVNMVLDTLSKEEAAKKVMVIDSKLCHRCVKCKSRRSWYVRRPRGLYGIEGDPPEAP